MAARPIHKKRTALVVLGIVAALIPSGAATAAEGATVADAPEGNITVEVVAANGSGCPPGTASVTPQPDSTGFRIRYSEFHVEAGGTSDPVDRRRNCQIAVLVHVPAGWTFAIASTEYRGRAMLKAGATGLQRTNYYWQGSANNNVVDHTFDGKHSAVARRVAMVAA